MAQSRPRTRALDALITDIPQMGPSTGTDKEAYIGTLCSDPSNPHLGLFLALRLGRIVSTLASCAIVQTQTTLLVIALLAQKHQQQIYTDLVLSQTPPFRGLADKLALCWLNFERSETPRWWIWPGLQQLERSARQPS